MQRTVAVAAVAYDAYRWHVWWSAALLFPVGSALHFVFRWAGCARWVATFGAVNESTYEHLKIGMWPLLLWHLMHTLAYGAPLGRAVVAPLAAGACMVTVNAFCRVLQWEPFFFDLFLFWLSLVAGQATALRCWECPAPLAAFTALVVLLSILTFAPPSWPYLFGDPTRHGAVGIPPDACGGAR